jgi:hypothetical protein
MSSEITNEPCTCSGANAVGVVAVVMVYDYVDAFDAVRGEISVGQAPWFSGPFGWLLTDVVAIEPVPCLGAQGLWLLPPDVERQVLARERAAREARRRAFADAGWEASR